MARPTEGWKLRKVANLYYVRFTHAGERIQLPTGARDPEAASKEAAKLYADYLSGKSKRKLKINHPAAPILDLGALWLAEIERDFDPGTLPTLMVYVRRWEE